MRFRFSISVMMAVILLAGVIFAASASEGAHAVQAVIVLAPCVLVVGLQCTALLAAIYRQGERRGFWVGFVVFTYASLVIGWFSLPHRLTFFVLLAGLPFGYIGGVIGRAFAAERMKADARATHGMQ